MVPVNPSELTADDIVGAALEVLATDGLDAVSMRRVATELGVSPIPLYSRVGNKEALLDAMAHRLGEGLAPTPDDGETWNDYAVRWSQVLHDRRTQFVDSRLMIRGGRTAITAATHPLLRPMADAGIDHDAAVRAIRLLVWAVLGHAAMETARERDEDVDADGLFADHVRYVIDGLARDHR